MQHKTPYITMMSNAIISSKDDWRFTPDGQARGYIQPQRLGELWVHTGSTCNLRCPFCFEGSKPGDDRIQMIRFIELKPFIDEALTLGVEQFAFTGGESFVNTDMLAILSYALEYRECLVLSNATEPLMNSLQQVFKLLEKPYSLHFRVSLDYPDPKRHDASRGKGNFYKALQTMSRLYNAGFTISVARLQEPDENSEEIEDAYHCFFKAAGLPVDLNMTSFPDFMLPGSDADVPYITEDCMRRLDDEKRAQFMCNYSKMIVKKDGKISVYACTLVDDDKDYDLGMTLTNSMMKRVMLKHHRCYSCFAYGASCSEK